MKVQRPPTVPSNKRQSNLADSAFGKTDVDKIQDVTKVTIFFFSVFNITNNYAGIDLFRINEISFKL